MICIPITAKTQDGMRAEMKAAAMVADLVEVRLDFAEETFDLKTLLENRPCPVIVTYRPTREGGHYDGPEAERLAVLQEAIDCGAEYVDVELDAVSGIRRGGKTQLIVSRHDFEKTPDNLEKLHAEIVQTGANISKVVTMATDIRDNLRMFELLRGTNHKTIALCMGELGVVSRILGRKFGNLLTFGALDTGKESAPGQVSAVDLRDLYRYKKIGLETAIYGVIANPVAHSMSPTILNAAFDAAAVDAVYLPFKVEGDVVEFVNAYKMLDVQGYSVTIPHKQAIMGAMDELDEMVKKIGAMNMVTNRNGKLHGTNTDILGALKALEDAIERLEPRSTRRSRRTATETALEGKRVLLLGAGGAARALAYGLFDRGALVIIANRTYERGKRLAEELGCDCLRLEEIADCRADILINTTSVGMTPDIDASPATVETLRPGMVVFDAVYNPPETKLLREAKAAGCHTVSGVTWFVNQAALQFERWCDVPAPRDVMERILRERL